MRVQKHPLQPAAAHRLIEFSIAVFFVPRDRMADVRCVHADLVCTAGVNVRLDQRCDPAEELHRTKDAQRGFAAALHHPHGALTADAMIDLERRLDTLLTELPAPLEERQISFLEAAFANQLMKRPERAPALCHQQTSAGVPVDAMHELELLLRPKCPQGLDHSEADAASAVDGDAGGLIEHEDPVVLTHDRSLDACEEIAADTPRCGGVLEPDGRDANAVARLQAKVRSGAPAVHSNFTFADNSLDPASRNPRQEIHQKPVEAPSGFFGADLDVADGCFGAHR
jgi:hypothetical protein